MKKLVLLCLFSVASFGQTLRANKKFIEDKNRIIRSEIGSNTIIFDCRDDCKTLVMEVTDKYLRSEMGLNSPTLTQRRVIARDIIKSFRNNFDYRHFDRIVVKMDYLKEIN